MSGQPSLGTAILRLTSWWVREKGVTSRCLSGEVVALTEKGIRVRAHAHVGPSETCHRCGKLITDPASRLLGYGPECARALGLPARIQPADVERLRAEIQAHVVEDWFPRKFAYLPDGRPFSVVGTAPPAQHTPASITVRLSADGERLEVTVPYNSWINEQLRNVPGHLWDSRAKHWTVPLTQGEAIFDLYYDLVGQEPEGEWVQAMIGAVVARDRQVAASHALAAELTIPGLAETEDLALFPYQRAGVAYAARTKRTFIADEMGLGKSAQAIATVQFLNAYPCVVVCPASVKTHWRREVERWVPALAGQVRVLEGRAATTLAPAPVYIVNYDVLEAWQAALSGAGLQAVVFDEAHNLKNPQAQRSRAALALARTVPVRLALTGTAAKNRADELLHPLRVLGRLTELGGYTQFVKRYVEQSSPARDLELNERLRACCYVRREKREVYQELPPKRRLVLPLEIDNRDEYARAEADLIAYLQAEAALDDRFVASLQDLPVTERAQAIAAYRAGVAYRARRAEQLVRFNTLKQVATRGKLTSVIDWIAQFLRDQGEQEKLLVFAHHRSTVQALAEHFGCASIDGDTPLAQRQQAVDTFQQDPQARLLVLNLQAGGVGLTLTAARTVAFVELPWTPADIQQAEDRCYGRVNDLHGATSWFLLAADTVEERIAQLLDAKTKTTDALNKGVLHAPTDAQSLMTQLVAALLRRPDPLAVMPPAHGALG